MQPVNEIPQKVSELVGLFGDDTTLAVREYYRLNDDTSIVWMQQPAHKFTRVKLEEGFELIVFEEWWIAPAMSWLLCAYSREHNELFIAGELIES